MLCDDPPSRFAYFEHHVDRIYVDRNGNGDLTDDGPPLVLARNRRGPGHPPGRRHGAGGFLRVRRAVSLRNPLLDW